MTKMIKNIILISNHSLQIHALKICLEPKLNVKLTIADIDSYPLQINNELNVFVLIDLASLNDKTRQFFQKELKRYSAPIALLNAKDNITIDEIVAWPNIYGYFKCNDNFDVLCKGLIAMMAGEYWLSSRLITQLINYYRNHQVTDHSITYEPKSSTLLTCREEEILRALTKRTSNIEIANKLFISEHTIKSHLYHIYKKIKVKNRQQAIDWAHSNLH